MTISSFEKASITSARSERTETLRTASPGLEELMYDTIPVLDHGFVRVVDYIGNDSSIVQAARVSYGKGTKQQREDAALINYLMQHNHTTPFEMAEIKIHVRLPIFVARQWVRHRTANINEYSARYSLLDKEFYIPTESNLASQSMTNRQGRGSTLTGKEATDVLTLLRTDAETAYQHYLELLNQDPDGAKLNPDRQGLARELARINLSLNYYTQWYWKIDLHNLMHFISLRADPHAQFEIRVYADVLLKILHRWVPMTANAFQEHRLGAVTLSATAVQVLRDLISGNPVTAETSGLSTREWNDLRETFGL